MGAEPERQLADPPATWQEHWFDHRQLLRLYHHDEHCAIYLDPDVRRAEIRWLPRFINVTWQYSKATYGDAFGPDPRIYSIHHAGRHGGGHAGYYVSPVHDYHNVSDCGLDTWREGNTLARELPAHEIEGFAYFFTPGIGLDVERFGRGGPFRQEVVARMRLSQDAK